MKASETVPETTAAWAPQGTPRFNAPEDVAAIIAVEEKLAVELDVDKVIELYADDAVVLDLFAPGTFQGREEIYAGFKPQLGAIASLTGEAKERVIATDGSFGCAASQIAYVTTMKDGRTFSMNLRQLDALKKIDGEWKVVQQHLSLPIDRETMQAIVDAPIQPREFTWSDTPLAPVSTTPEQAKEEIREFMDVGGASTSLDMLMRYYGPGDDVLLYDAFHPTALIGRQEIRDYYAPLMNSYGGIELEMPMFIADSNGSFGVQIDTQNITLKMKDGTTQEIALRQSDCMRRVDGKWYSFLEMVSYPVDEKTYRAVMRPDRTES